MNLPERIFANDGEIRYIYSAAGEKLGMVSEGSLTYYRSVMVYGQQGEGPERLLYVLHPEGLVSKTTGGYVYRYFKRDYQGNVRLLLSGDGQELVEDQRTDYYPYGLAHAYENLHLNPYLYSEKEYQSATMGRGMLGLYDFGSRYYNPLYGRWFNIDPALQLANPYVYCGNNPVMFVDPNGEFFLTAFLIGALIGGVTYTASVAMSPGGFDNWSWSNFGKSLGIGGISGMAAFGIGQAFGNVSTFGHELGRGLVHGLVQGGINGIGGGDFEHRFLSGAASSWVGSAFGAGKWGYSRLGMYGSSAVAGGVGSWIGGGSFWQGASIGVLTAGLNHLQNGVTKSYLPDWDDFSHQEKMALFLRGREEAIGSGKDYFDIRKYVNYPFSGSGEEIGGIINILGEDVPMHMNVSYHRNMRTKIYPRDAKRSFDHKYNVMDKGRVTLYKRGAWDTWTFYQSISKSKYPIPTMSIAVPVSRSNFFYNYVYK